jgi:hypothetical protein
MAPAHGRAASEAAGAATRAVAEAWEAAQEPGDVPVDLLHLLLRAAERVRTMLARLVLYMEAARERARMDGEEASDEDAAAWAVSREASRGRELLREAREWSGYARGRRLADEPLDVPVPEAAPPQRRDADEPGR